MRLRKATALAVLAAGVFITGCIIEETVPRDDDDTSTAGSGGSGTDPNLNTDGDCMTDLEEIALGTDPNAVDSDGDSISDCDEISCVSDPMNGAEKCYQCGWKHNDPGNLISTGATEGSTIANVGLVDQCGEPVPLWDFAGEYHILFLTAAW
jgi:hypothetical protein